MVASGQPCLTIEDVLDPARAVALQATLGFGGPPLTAGDQLPPFWHQIYFWSAPPLSDLGPDGHQRTGAGLIPDLGLPQRMWAGGKLVFHAPVQIGQPARKTTVLDSVTRKTGRSGPLGFVTLRHEIWQAGELCITEHQHLVYKVRGRDGQAARPERAAPEAVVLLKERAAFSPTLLFRYSALTFNGHRIHYDLGYCREVETHRGLVVHGPLLAQKLIHLAELESGALRSFEFRARRPLYHDETAEFCIGRDGECWVLGPDGGVCMTATAV